MKAFYFSETPKQFDHSWPYAYKHPLNALRHSSGPILNMVEIPSEIDETTTKIALESHTHLKSFDATEVLKKFARLQALINIEKIKPYCSDEDYSLIKKWLETGDDSLSSDAEEAALSAVLQAEYDAELVEYAGLSDEYAAMSAYHAAKSVEYAAKSAFSAKYAALSDEYAVMSANLSAMHAVLSAEYTTESALSAAESADYTSNNLLVNMIKEATGWRI